MVVEHSFITTLDETVALNRAAWLLEALGFSRDLESPDHVRTLHRGKPAASARKISELPQHARIEFDRGRVTVALSIEPRSKAGPLHQELLLAGVAALELHIGHDRPVAEVRVRWDEAEQRIEAKARPHRIAVRVVGIVAVLLLIGLFALVIGLALQNRG